MSMSMKWLFMASIVAGSMIANAEIRMAPIATERLPVVDVNQFVPQQPHFNPPPAPHFNPPPPRYNPPPQRTYTPPPPQRTYTPPPQHTYTPSPQTPPQRPSPPPSTYHPNPQPYRPGGGTPPPNTYHPPAGGDRHYSGQQIHNGGSVVHRGGQQFGRRHIPVAAAAHVGHRGHLDTYGVWYDDDSDPIYMGEFDDGTVISMVTFSFTNSADDNLQVEMFSENSSDVWPGSGQAYVLNNGASLTQAVNCTAGENICYGGWKADDGQYTWGAGHSGAQKQCQGCCLICDGRSNTWNLTP
jgi:hypothetical protein